MSNRPYCELTKLKPMQIYLYARGEISPEFLAYMKDFRLVLRTIEAHAGLFAVVLARFSIDAMGNTTFEFDPDGVPSAVIEVIRYDETWDPITADLVCWPLHDPWSFATALGPNEGPAMLGQINMEQRGGLPLKVYPTPLDWIQNGCEGCVPLDNACARDCLDKAGGPFLVRDIEDGRWLRDLLGPVAHRHRILLPHQEKAA